MLDSIVKPPKPYPEFPMYPHASKRWAAKIKGVTRYFGHWRDWESALDRYQYEVHFFKLGKTPPPRDIQALQVGDMVNLYLEYANNLVRSGELARRTWIDSKRAGELLIASLGRYTTVESLEPKDFAKLRSELTKRVSLATVLITIQRCRVFFNWAVKNEHIPKPPRFGGGFDKPTVQSLEKEKSDRPIRFFCIEELTTLYKAASPQLRCFMLLGLNCGFGNGDIGKMEAKHVQGDWIRFPRPKTQVKRECPLWLETIQAIEATRQTLGKSNLVFLSSTGGSWHKNESSSSLCIAFKNLQKECGLHNPGRGFYSLRHNFRTAADGSRDRVAIDLIMGHKDPSMGANYRHGVEPERLQAVVDHVRKWALPMLNAVKGGAK